MKKILAITFVIILALGVLAGCGATEETPDTGEEVTEVTEIGRASCRERV